MVNKCRIYSDTIPVYTGQNFIASSYNLMAEIKCVCFPLSNLFVDMAHWYVLPIVMLVLNCIVVDFLTRYALAIV